MTIKISKQLSQQILTSTCRQDIVFAAMPENAHQFLLANRKLLFPLKKNCTEQSLELAFENLSVEFDKLFIDVNACKVDVTQLKNDFFGDLQSLHKILSLDAQAILAKDPAANNCFEIVAAYPGFLAIMIYRLANYFFKRKVPLIPRLLSEVAHGLTGIDIHPGAEISESFAIDHGTGIVIGETCVIGKNVTIYQGVTLGGLVVDKESSGKKRHPTIEDGATIYANATILGGNTVIGRNSVIGGNTWITSTVPANSRIKFTN